MWLACVILVGMGITSMSTNLQLAAHPQHWRQYDMQIQAIRKLVTNCVHYRALRMNVCT